MKWLYYILPCLMAATASAQLFDSTNCLPPLENDERLFPRCKEIFGNLEFLYWTVEEGALDYAIKRKEQGWAPNTESFHFANGKVKKTTFDFHPGVRALIGFYNAPKFWEIFAQYTYFQDSGRDKARKPQENDLFLVGTFPQASDFFGNFLSMAKSKVDLHYQLVDVMFSRVFDPNPHLRMRMLAGISGAFLNQMHQIDYFDNECVNTHIRNSWNYNAGGLRVGLAADWWWKWGLYFTGKASLAGFSGRYTNRARVDTDFQPSPAFDIEANVQDISYHDSRYAQHLQLLLGPAWHHIGCSYHFEIFIGYEMNGWLNLQEVYRSTSSFPSNSAQLMQTTSALMLQGLTIRATAGF